MGLDLIPLHLRPIRIELDTGEIEVLITSLVDEKNIPAKSSRICILSVGPWKLIIFS